MQVVAGSHQVQAGTVSLRVANVGRLTHELVVVPLAVGQRAGQRRAGSDGKVDETGSVGEVSRTCDSGTGDGIGPGAAGWGTLHLEAGDYELFCNLPGHYSAGMFTTIYVQ